MQTGKSSSALKAIARERLLGNYKTVILAYAIIQLITSGCLSIVESQSDFHSVSGSLIYYAVYLILTLFLAVFTTGQYHMYVKLLKGQQISARDIWYPFRTLADKCIFAQILIFLQSLLFAAPFFILSVLMLQTKNYYLSIPVSASAILFMVVFIIIQINCSQVFFLLLDHPDASVRELLSDSRKLMYGRKANYFYLMVSFTGIFFLVLLTLGIGMLWAYPYITCVKALFYLDITQQDITPKQQNKPTINLTA